MFLTGTSNAVAPVSRQVYHFIERTSLLTTLGEPELSRRELEAAPLEF